jgi:hypothetical protein
MISVIREAAAAQTALEAYRGPVGIDLETSGKRPHRDDVAVLSLCLHEATGPVPIIPAPA